MKIVSDSSCDIFAKKNISFTSVPFKISTDIMDFNDDITLNVKNLTATLKTYKGRTRTGCPGIQAFMDAFEDENEIYVLTVTKGLSGSYNSALAAANEYKESHPDAKIYVFDTLSAGPEIRLAIDKISKLYEKKLPFEEICQKTSDYLKSTRLFFSLQSLHNLAMNGRVNKLTAGTVGLLGIRIVGTASNEGTLEVISKCRGEQKAIIKLVEEMKTAGYTGGKVYIAHVFNPNLANLLKKHITDEFPKASVKIYETRGLCSFYAESGGILVGCEC